MAALATFAQSRPKLIVGIVVDQMRWDYLHRYYDLYGEGGFKRIMNEGFDCENTMINYIPAITAVGTHLYIYGFCTGNPRHTGKLIPHQRQVHLLHRRYHSGRRRH